MGHYKRPAWKSPLRRLLFAAQGGGNRAICAICGVRLTEVVWIEPGWNASTIDHVVPRALDGFDGPGNLVLAHLGCNSWKGDRPPTGCELIWLMAVNARLGVEPIRW